MIDLITIDQNKFQHFFGKIDLIDIAIISKFNHIIYASGMESIQYQNRDFYKVNYNKVILLLPSLNLKIDSIYRRFKKLTDLNIFFHHPQSQKFSTAYYRLNESALKINV